MSYGYAPDHPLPIHSEDLKRENAELHRLRRFHGEALALLDDVLEDLADVIPYAGEYFDEKWGYRTNLGRFRSRRAALGEAQR